VAGGARHGAKMFAASAMDPADWSVSLKCEPALAEQLRAAHPEITGAWHMNKTHWNGVRLDGSLPDDMIRDMVEDSYDLVVASLSRKQQEQLGWARLAGARGAASADGASGSVDAAGSAPVDAARTAPVDAGCTAPVDAGRTGRKR
jgi:predicted DNA-binding protein (MmcQ/YjbR family)